MVGGFVGVLFVGLWVCLGFGLVWFVVFGFVVGYDGGYGFGGDVVVGFFYFVVGCVGVG